MVALEKTALEDSSLSTNKEELQITINDLPQIIKLKSAELTAARKDVLILLGKPHDIEAVEKRENWVREYEIDLLNISEFLDDEPKGLKKKALRKYGAQCDRLSDAAMALGIRLAAERKELELQQKENKQAKEDKKKDKDDRLSKLFPFMILYPSMIYAHLKLRSPDNSTEANVIYSSVLAAGLGIHFKDSIKNAWKRTANDLHPTHVKNSAGFIAYYVKESIAVSEFSPSNLKRSIGCTTYCAKETAIEKGQEFISSAQSAGQRTKSKVLKSKPIRRILDWKKKIEKENNLS